MQQRPRRAPTNLGNLGNLGIPGSLGIRRLALAGVAVALVALLLARWQPWRTDPPSTPRPVAIVATPTPIPPTPTRAPERIAPADLPATPPPAPPATPLPGTPTGPRADGTILYVGEVAGRKGIVAAAAGGGDQRLIAAGEYTALAWSPDGTHFAAAGPLQGDVTSQLAIFAADGRPLARHPFEGRVGTRLLWSPDGRELAWFVFPLGGRAPDLSPLTETWRVTIDGAARRVPVPDAGRVAPFAWLPEGHLVVISFGPAGDRIALWRSGPGEGLPVPLIADTVIPIAFGDDGETLYVLGPTIRPAPIWLVAVNLRTGARRTIADAARIGAVAFGAAAAPGTDTLPVALFAPDGAHLALVVERPPGAGAPVPRSERALVILARDGAITGVAQAARDNWTWPMVWSPDSALLAFNADGTPVDESALYIVDTRGEQRASAPFSLSTQRTSPSFDWSPDGRWLAFADLRGVIIISPSGAASYTLAPLAGVLAWQP